MHYYQHHIGDFIKSTSFLTNEEIGIYMKLIWYYYDTECPIENNIDQLCVRVSARDQKDKVEWLLKTFFVLNEDGSAWINHRCEQEIAEYYEFINSKRKAGKASAAKRLGNKSSTDVATEVEHVLDSGSTDVQLTTNHKPLTTNHKPKKEATDVAAPDGVSPIVWFEFVAHRKTKKAKVTELVLQGLMKEAEKAGWSLEDVLKEIILRNWQSFKADWVQPRQGGLVNKYDAVTTTVPGSKERDPALVKLEQDAKQAAAPSLETLARLAALRQELKNG